MLVWSATVGHTVLWPQHSDVILIFQNEEQQPINQKAKEPLSTYDPVTVLSTQKPGKVPEILPLEIYIFG